MRKFLLIAFAVFAALSAAAQEPVFTEAELDSILNDTIFKHLSEVEVKAIRPLVKAEIDRLSYDVQGDGDAKTSTVLEMLRKVPLVTVDAEDNIRVKGSTSFKIYKNGHPDPGISSNPKEVLKAIPASMIKRIEVITEPGAKYDAEGVGAILNIVLNDNSQMGGITGTVSAGIDHTGSPNASAYVTTQVGRWTTSINYGTQLRNRRANKQLSDEQRIYKDGHQLLSHTEGDAKVNVHYGNIESSLEIDSLNLLSLSFGGFYYNYTGGGLVNWRAIDAAGNMMYRYQQETSVPLSSYYNFNGRMDYEHKTRTKGEALTLSYMLSTSRNKQNSENRYLESENMPVDYPGTYNHGRETFVEHTGQFDWTRPFARHNTIETGLKYIYRMNRSNTSFAYNAEGVDPIVTRFNHLTQVGAAYASYTYRLDKWTARAGVRYEWSHLSGKYPDGSQKNFSTDLSDWVPSASIGFQPSMTHSLKLAFATRIARPGISYLNPAVIESPTTLNYGNPDLSSARNYSLSMTYMFISPKITFNIVPGYSFSNNGITSVQFTSDGMDHTTYANTLSTRSFDLSGYAQWQIVDGTSLMVNGNVNYGRLRSKDLNLTNTGWGSFFYSQVTQQLPWKLRLTANVGEWTGGADDLYQQGKTSWFYGFGLQRSFLKEDRLTVRINAQRPFSGKYSHYENDYVQGDYTGHQKFAFSARSFGISISYRFGSLRAQVKKTAATIDNNDVVGGSSAGGNQQGGAQQGQQGH